MRRLAAVPALAALAAAIAAAGQGITVEVVGAPGPLILPPEPGRPAVLIARVDGFEPGAVFLAASSEALGRVLLRPAGDGRHVLDLSEPVALAVLRLEARDGRFRVFASTHAGMLVASEPVQFRMRGETPPEPWLHASEGSTTRPLPRRVEWIRPAGVRVLTALLGRVALPAEGLRAEAGEGESFAFKPWPGRAELEVTDDVRAAWTRAGRLRIPLPAEWCAAGPEARTLRAIPDRFGFPGVEARIVVAQRATTEVPGTNGWLLVTLGDIERGAVALSVKTATGEEVVPARVVRAGEDVDVGLADERGRLSVEGFTDRLLGTDTADLLLTRTGPGSRPTVADLMAEVAASDARFVREGLEVDGATAAAYLRAKWEGLPDRTGTVEEFVARVATASSTTGRPYRVRLPDGREVALADWLRERISEWKR